MEAMEEWIPKTALGKMVVRGDVKTMAQALRSGLPLREPEIVDILLPELEDEVLDVNMVQRMTDSGRRINFVITVVVGNGDGYVGLGRSRGKEVGPAIRKAIENAKLNIIEIKRGCGSWECGCYRPHTLPFKIVGKSGSVEVTLKPAPRGVGLAVADVAKSVVRLAGIEDVWGFAKGHTKTTVNYAQATFNALMKTMEFKIGEDQARKLHILSGPVRPFEVDLSAQPEPEPAAQEAAPPESEEAEADKPEEETKEAEEKPETVEEEKGAVKEKKGAVKEKKEAEE
jgi:small subunit ribosomal protein S5